MSTQQRYYLAPEGYNSESWRDVYSEDELREYLRGTHQYDRDDEATNDVEQWITDQIEDCEYLGEHATESDAVLEAIRTSGRDWDDINPLHISALIGAGRHGDIVAALWDADVAPTDDYTADSGADYGYVAAWQLRGRGGYLIQYGDNGTTEYDTTDDISDLADWLIPADQSDDTPVQIATVRGIDAVDAAESDYAGTVCVIESHNYYGPRTEHGWVREDDGQQSRREWQSAAEAQEWIDEQESKVYCTEHNESGRPTYTIVEA